MDLDDKRSEAMEVTQLKEEEPKKKTCVDCGTTKTPLWRGGPAGPMTLCNACGIKSRKKRGALLGGSNKTQTKEKKSSKKATSQTTKSSSGNSNGSSKSKLGRSLDQRLIALGKEVLMRRSKTDQQRRKKLGEEEQAAVLLMALSYGYVYA